MGLGEVAPQKSYSVEELWVYPVKSMRGIEVQSSRLTRYGLEYDRCFCVVDLLGKVVAKNEAISARKISSLLTIHVEFSATKDAVVLSHPEVTNCLTLPLETGHYLGNESILVEASGKSTTTEKGWSFGFIPSKLCSSEANEWINDFLNTPARNKGFRNGKSIQSKFALVRCVRSLNLSDFDPIFPILKTLQNDSKHKTVTGKILYL